MNEVNEGSAMEANRLNLITAVVCRGAAQLDDGSYHYVGVSDVAFAPPGTDIRRMVALEFQQPKQPGTALFQMRMVAPDGSSSIVFESAFQWEGHAGKQRVQADVELMGGLPGGWTFIAILDDVEVARLSLDVRPAPPEPSPTVEVAEGFGGPFLQSAVFCDRLLREADGTISLIRLIDQFTLPWLVPAIAESDSDGFLGANMVGTLLIGLKSGDFRGRYVVILEVQDPEGRPGLSRGYPMPFEGGEKGFNLILPFDIRSSGEGVYWFTVRIEERMLTRVPIRVVYETVRERDSSRGAYTGERSSPSSQPGAPKRRRKRNERGRRSK